MNNFEGMEEVKPNSYFQEDGLINDITIFALKEIGFSENQNQPRLHFQY